MPSTGLAWIIASYYTASFTGEALVNSYRPLLMRKQCHKSHHFQFFATFKFHALKKLRITSFVDEVEAMGIVLHRLP